MRYLFERLSEPEARARLLDRRTPRPPHEVRARARRETLEAIEENLQRVLVSASGGVWEAAIGLLDYGLPPVSEPGYDGSRAQARIAARIKQMVEHYEPRLGGVQVEVERVPHPISPYRVTVSASLVDEEVAEDAVFHLELMER